MSAIAAENWPEALACWRQAIRFEMGILRLLDEVGIDEKLLEEVKSQGIYVVAGSGFLGAEFLAVFVANLAIRCQILLRQKCVGVLRATF